jgi:hypothetical protein
MQKDCIHGSSCVYGRRLKCTFKHDFKDIKRWEREANINTIDDIQKSVSRNNKSSRDNTKNNSIIDSTIFTSGPILSIKKYTRQSEYIPKSNIKSESEIDIFTLANYIPSAAPITKAVPITKAELSLNNKPTTYLQAIQNDIITPEFQVDDSPNQDKINYEKAVQLSIEDLETLNQLELDDDISSSNTYIDVNQYQLYKLRLIKSLIELNFARYDINFYKENNDNSLLTIYEVPSNGLCYIYALIITMINYYYSVNKIDKLARKLNHIYNNNIINIYPDTYDRFIKVNEVNLYNLVKHIAMTVIINSTNPTGFKYLNSESPTIRSLAIDTEIAASINTLIGITPKIITNNCKQLSNGDVNFPILFHNNHFVPIIRINSNT